MKLLITNDDGFDAPGIQLLASLANDFGEVTIVAPAMEQSGISHRISFEKPLQLKEHRENGYSVDGTPADCVRVAMSLWQDRFDLVLSGVNNGANLGVDVMYSGTVGAAREATFFGIPAIAISQYRANYSTGGCYDFEKTKPLIRRIVSDVLSQPMGNEVTNVNLPDRAASTDAEQIKLVECQVDPSPLPPQYKQTEQGLIDTASYSERPKIPNMDTAICFAGDVSISKIRF